MTETGLTVLRKTGILTIEWKINGVFELSEDEDYYLDSSVFSFAEDKWYLRLYPNGRLSKDSVGWVSLYLHKIHSENMPVVSFRFGIKKPNESFIRYYSDVFTAEESGSDKFIERTELYQSKNIITPNNILTLLCTLSLVEGNASDAPTWTSSDCAREGGQEESSEASTGSVNTLVQHFKDLFESKMLDDVKIQAKDRDYLAHRCILAARSNVFAAMFEHEMVEKSSGVVPITDCDPESFHDFLLFMYTGALDHVSPTNALGLYVTADKYNMKELMKACVDCLESNLTVDSVCDVVYLGVTYRETKLLKTATNYFIDNAKIVLATDKWQKFLLDYRAMAHELVVQMANRYTKK